MNTSLSLILCFLGLFTMQSCYNEKSKKSYNATVDVCDNTDVYAGFVSNDNLSVSTSACLGVLQIMSMGLGLRA